MDDANGSSGDGRPRETWTFLSNHGHVILKLAQSPGIRLRDLASHVGITERGVQRIVAELVDSGVLERRRVGRRNTYTVDLDCRLRHPIEGHCRVRDLVEMVRKGNARASAEDSQAASAQNP